MLLDLLNIVSRPKVKLLTNGVFLLDEHDIKEELDRIVEDEKGKIISVQGIPRAGMYDILIFYNSEKPRKCTP